MIRSPPSPATPADGNPWRPGNRFHLIAVSEEFFARMLEAIDDAGEYVLLEMYLVESGELTDRFVQALAAAAGRGVKVCALLDGFGSLGFSTADRARLVEAGVELRFYNALSWRKRLHNFLRDHRKLLLVDGCVAFVGGAGLTDEFAGVGGKGPPWRDQMVRISGPVMADWRQAFARTWQRSGGRLSLPRGRPDDPAAGDATPENAPVDGASGRVSLSEARARSTLATDVVRRIEAATERAWIMSAYFVPSRRFRKALRRTARRRVDVRLLVPGPRTDHPWVRDAARRFYGKMLRSGVRIFEYQPRVLHGKMILCDDWVSVGSSNLDRWSFKWNLEANQEILDAGFADDVAEVFENDCRESAQLSARHWPQRAWFHRLRERIAGAIDRWLDRWRRPGAP
jgi:phosphatidylserine/phosphatidylglycerophosphate/cardiolipin synthase-like enzyme